MNAIRPSAVAGMFYPADAAQLQSQLQGFLATAAAAAAGPVPKALIAPHAGYVYSGAVAASAYARVAPARGRISRVVLIGPSHRVRFRGLAASAADAWRTPLGLVPLDRVAVEALLRVPLVGVLPQAHQQEHSLEVHVPFLQAVLGEFSLVPLVAGEAGPDTVAAVLDAAWGGPETLIVISTDLSHYLDYGACQATDRRTVAAIERLDFAALSPEGACGCVPVAGMLLAAQRRGMTIETLDVRNSGDTAGPRERVVGYGSWALFEGAASARLENGRSEPAPDPAAAALAALGPRLVALARQAITSGLATGEAPAVAATGDLPPALAAPGATFVTLKRRGELRGCIGSPMAHRPLIEDVTENAFRAAFKDPRFPPLRQEELVGLEVSVSVLTPPSPMRFADEADLLAQLRPGTDGLIIQDGERLALLLPSVWEQLPDRRQFLGQLKLKAGLAVDHWSPGFRASRFEAVEIKEARPAGRG